MVSIGFYLLYYNDHYLKTYVENVSSSVDI